MKILNMEFVPKNEIPPIMTTGRLPSKEMQSILKQLVSVPTNQVLRLTMDNKKVAHQLSSSLYYYQNKKGRGEGAYPNLRIARRENTVFIWLDSDESN